MIASPVNTSHVTLFCCVARLVNFVARVVELVEQVVEDRLGDGLVAQATAGRAVELVVQHAAPVDALGLGRSSSWLWTFISAATAWGR